MIDLISKLSVSRQRFTQRIVVEFPITNCRAAARAAAALEESLNSQKGENTLEGERQTGPIRV